MTPSRLKPFQTAYSRVPFMKPTFPSPAQKTVWPGLSRGSLPLFLTENLPAGTLKVVLTQDVEQALRLQTAWQFFRPHGAIPPHCCVFYRA